MQNRKVALSFFFAFLLFGMVFHSPIIFAQEDDDLTSNSGRGSSDSATADADNSDSSEDTDDSDSRSDKRVKVGNGKERTEERIREKDGKIEREVKGRFIDEDGNEVRFERKIKIKDGEVEIETKLKVSGRGSNLSVSDSEGRKHRVRVTPEKLKALMIERLNAENVTDFSLEEIKHKNIPRVVYKINSEHPGRFLGVFKIAMNAETQIDPETGEVLGMSGPWWAFLVAEQLPDEDEIVGNETLAEEVVADDDELDSEFEDVEVDGGLKIKAETLDGSSEIDVELEFNSATSNMDEIASEILNRLTLSSEEIEGLLEIEESDELLEDEEELEFEVETKEDSTEVEFEIQFSVNSSSREDIISAIIERLSTLTSAQINNALTSEDDDENEEDGDNNDEDDDDETEDEDEEKVEPIRLN